MKRYLSLAEIAKELGVTRQALRDRQQRGQWPEPDAVIGRAQGWTRETLEKAGKLPKK